MNKCSPVQMRKNLEAVEMLRVAGIDFVPIPTQNEKHKIELVKELQAQLQKAIDETRNTNS